MNVIVIEGVNGSGKSTVGARLHTTLSNSRDRLCLAADPAGFGLMGQGLREHLVDPSTRSSPDLDAVLFAALRAEGVRRILDLFGSRQRSFVVLERWSAALAAYGRADGARLELVAELRTVLAQLLTADLTILLDISGACASSRLAALSRPNRFEARGPEYLEDVAKHYRDLALQEGGIEVVDASRDPSAVHEAVVEVIGRKWPDLFKSHAP